MSLHEPYVVSLIPARSGSKGILNKNLSLLGGKSLLAWSISASLKSASISRTIVSTDSEEYAELARGLGAEVPFLRPDSISQDKSTDYEFVSHALSYFQGENSIPDLIAHLRPTTPFRNPVKLNEAIAAGLKNENKATALRSVHEMSESAYKSFELSENGNLVSTFTKLSELDNANNGRQSFASTYSPNGYVDLLFPAFIRDFHLLHGNRVFPINTDFSIEIDDEDNLVLAEAMLALNPDIYKRLFEEN